jgi:glycosyltransferase involved in cell wall biosynthesis
LRFSILLPTRDRLEYLRQAVETVTRQDYDDWELIVSDNCSAGDVAGFVAGLDDPRIKYLCTSEVVSVTENWNKALDASSGDYVLMLGDDDGLLPGYFRAAEKVIADFGEPDVLYSRALLLAYPGVMPGHEAGYLHLSGCAAFFDDLVRPRLLESGEARELVQATMDFRYRFDFNMQLFTIKRSTIELLRRAGHFFHSPFPDYYAANLLFLRSERIVICPDPLATIGVTPKSYGFFHFNSREEEGAAFLRNVDEKTERALLPGTRMNTCWLLAMRRLAELDSGSLGLVPSYRRYRLVQVVDWFMRRFVGGTMSRDEFREATRALRPWEKAVVRPAAALLAVMRPLRARRVLLGVITGRVVRQYPRFAPELKTGGATVIDLFEDPSLVISLAPRLGQLSPEATGRP